MRKIIPAILFLLNFYIYAFAAVGCSLDDPDRDVKRLFPDSSGYKATFITLKEIGGEALQKDVENKLGDKLDPVYENLDVGYAYYAVLKGKDIAGYIHGVNQKGKFGVLQLVVATDLDGKILEFYFQKISSPESSKFRAKAFTDQFKDLNLEDFYRQDGLVSKIIDPSVNSREDFKATIRGIKKNLILLDEFLHIKVSKGGK
jgi:hypothetical protein